MSLVGNIIMGCRNAAVDVPQGLLTPPAAELAAALFATSVGVTLPVANYYVKLTYRTVWGGETSAGPETGPLAVDATHGIQITGSLPLGVSAVVAYIGTAFGAETFAFVSTSLPLQITSIAGGYPAAPPLRNRAYLPDTDGAALSATAIFDWLNDGLKEASAKCGGGMPDMSGVASVAGQGLYQLQGSWWRCLKAWYDGYPMSISGSDVIFRKNKVTGNYSMGFFVAEVQDRVLIEAWPQPSRTSGQMTLTNAITATQTGNIAVTAGASQFVLGFGLAQIGTEIVYYSNLPAGQITVVARGMGGTIPQAWPANTPVLELNLMFIGLRNAPIYSVGQSSLTLNVPPGWEPALSAYMRYRFKQAEKDYKGAQAEYKQFSDTIAGLPLNKPVGGPRQIQIGGSRGVETMSGLGTTFSGVIVP